MNIKFTISKSYNHFFFVQTLADWHFSCRSQYIKEWLKITGPLTEQEIDILADFKVVMKKYGFNSLENCEAQNAFDFFMRYESFQNKKPFPEDEIKVYLNAMDILEDKFNQIWELEDKKLSQISEKLDNKFNYNKNEIISDLKILFNEQIDLNRETEVILLLSTRDSGSGGGANNGPNIISLECSSATDEDIENLLSILWHEITHIALENYIKETALLMNNNQLVKEISIEAKENDFNYSEELLSFSLFSPISFFTDKFFPNEIVKKLEEAVLKKDVAWLLEARYVFIMYLIYLNGQFIKKQLIKKQYISPDAMTNNIVINHEIIKDFFAENNKNLKWFSYDE